MSGINLSVMRRNAGLGVYGVIARPHILALIDTVEAAHVFIPQCDEGVVHDRSEPDCPGCLLRAGLDLFDFEETR